MTEEVAGVEIAGVDNDILDWKMTESVISQSAKFQSVIVQSCYFQLPMTMRSSEGEIWCSSGIQRKQEYD